ncbi:MAG: hypothetical protein N3C60_04960 [Calditerrivibrio sp.]|nr:hypothetical protein [Calditerrivibrio sp.]
MRIVILLFFVIVSFTLSHAEDEKLLKILNREKELVEIEKNLHIEENNRKTTIMNNANECINRAKNKKEIRTCNKTKNDELEFLKKEMKFRKEQIANERKDLAEQKRKLKSSKKRSKSKSQ